MSRRKGELGHILGLREYTKHQRIHRCDEIKDFILDTTIKENKEVVASREPTLQLPNSGKLKPDLVIKNPGQGLRGRCYNPP